MNVLGLDLSLTATGVAYPEGTTSVYTTKLAGTARLIAIRDKLAADLDTPDAPVVDLAVIEDLPINARAAGATGMLHGVIRVWLAEQRIPTVLVPPASLKKFAVNVGNAGKDAMLAAAVRAGFAGSDNNAADAWWLRQLGLYPYGDEQVNRTAFRDEALRKIPWPDLSEGAAA